ncbi:helix-turn-helix transcriptional regulator [Novosphingobium umbonatum]|nr:helix-turn-helix transcriptional regulator [Novosphingobium umbonatum]
MTLDIKDIYSVIEQIYEAAGEEEGMHHILNLLKGQFQAVGALCFATPDNADWGGGEAPFSFSLNVGFDQNALATFQNDVWKEDYMLPFMARPSFTAETHEILTPEAQNSSEFIHWLRQHAGADRRIGRVAEVHPGTRSGLSLCLPVGLERSADMRQAFDKIAPHLDRVMGLSVRFGELSAQQACLETMLNQSQMAVLLLGRSGQLLWSNQAGQMLADDPGLFLWARGGPVPVEPVAQKAWRRHIALQGQEPTITPLLRLGPRHLAKLDRVSAPLRRAFGHQASHLVTIRHPQEPKQALAQARSALWSTLFGLTPSECRVADALMTGQRVADIATSLGVGTETIRTHEKHIFAKMQVQSRAEAAHVLTSLA